MSEELENSLQHAIESYLGKRLSAIDEQLSRLQSDFDSALKRLRESSVNESLDSTSLSAAIFAHLQTARSQKLSGATPALDQGQTALGPIKRAIEEIERQQSHIEILGALLMNSAQFAERVALFVVRNDQAIGWRECEANDPRNLEMIGGVSVPLSADTMLGLTVRSRSAWSGKPGSNSEDSLLIDQLGGHPQRAVVVPLVVREKVVAILYADSVSGDANAVNTDALELLSRVASMAVNLAAVARPASEKKSEEAAAVAEPAATVPEQQPTQTHEPAYSPAIEPQTPAPAIEEQFVTAPTESFGEPVADALPETAADDAAEAVTGSFPEYVPPSLPDYVPTEQPAASVAEDSNEAVTGSYPEYVPPALPDYVAEPAPAQPSHEVAADSSTADTQEMTPAPVAMAPEMPASTPAAPSFTSAYGAPLGGARRYGVSEPDLPIEVGDEERRLHNDARRFARLLVSEIKLYNEPKVKEGRNRGDIYDRLREDIDRSRQMYDKRVAPPVAARHDYFHQELVNTLAEGDPAKLGASYPGASVAAN